MYCEKCGTKNEDGTKFCIGCGNPMSAPAPAAAPVGGEDDLGGNAGTIGGARSFNPAPNPAPNPASAYSAPSYSAPSAPADGNGMKNIIKIVAGVVAVAVVATVGVNLFGKLGKDDEADMTKHPVVYMKDDEMKVLKPGKKVAYELTDDTEGEYGYTQRVKVTKDGKKLFFIDDADGGEFDLYWRETSDEKADKGFKIASGVTSYSIDYENGKYVIYQKSDKLYYSDLKNEPVSISSEVADYSIYNDGKKLLYKKSEDDSLYVSNIGKKMEGEKVSSDVVLYAMDEDGTIYFTKAEETEKSDDEDEYSYSYQEPEYSFWCVEDGKEKEKLAGDIASFDVVGENVYFWKADTKKVKYKDLINDDCKDDPEEPEWDYDFTEEEEEEYYAIIRRNSLREQMEQEEEMEISQYALYLVKKKGEPEKVDEGLSEAYFNAYNFEEGAALYFKADGTKKMDLSELAEQGGLYALSNSTGKDKAVITVDSKGKISTPTPLENDEKSFAFSEDGKYVYCIEGMKEVEYNDDGKASEPTGDLVKYTVSSKGLKNKKVLKEDITDYNRYDDDFIVVGNEYEKAIGVVNSKGKYNLLSEEKVGYETSYIDGAFYFLDNYSDKGYGDLVRYKNGKKTTIASDVHEFSARSDKLVYYIKDWSSKGHEGELYMTKGNSDGVKIDSEVSSIIW